MNVTLNEAYQTALATIGRLTVEQTFLQEALDKSRAEAELLQGQLDKALNPEPAEPGQEQDGEVAKAPAQ